MVKLMAHSCLREISSELQHAKYYTVIANKTTDSSNKEQLVTVFRSVDDVLQVHEEFVGLYQLDQTNAETIVTVLKDVLLALAWTFTNSEGSAMMVQALCLEQNRVWPIDYWMRSPVLFILIATVMH